MEIKDKEMIVNFGAIGYSEKKIASILEVSEKEISKEMSYESEFKKLYQKGVDMSDYIIDLKLFEMSKSGDLKALDKFEQRKRNRR